MKKYYLYIYYDVDGTPIYVGIDSTGKRWQSHWKGDTRLGRVLRKRERELNISLYPEFIEANSWEDAQLGEVLYIWCFGRADIGLGPLFNLTDGGEGGHGNNPSQQTRDKRGAAVRAALTGVPRTWIFSDDHKKRIGQIAKESNSKRCTVDGVKIYPSLKELILELGQGKAGSRSPNFRYVETEKGDRSLPFV